MCRTCQIAFLNVDYLVLSRIEFHVAKLPIFSSLRLWLYFLFLLPALSSFLTDLHNPVLSAGFSVLPFTLYQVTRTPSSASPSSGNLLPGAVTPCLDPPSVTEFVSHPSAQTPLRGARGGIVGVSWLGSVIPVGATQLRYSVIPPPLSRESQGCPGLKCPWETEMQISLLTSPSAFRARIH